MNDIFLDSVQDILASQVRAVSELARVSDRAASMTLAANAEDRAEVIGELARLRVSARNARCACERMEEDALRLRGMLDCAPFSDWD